MIVSFYEAPIVIQATLITLGIFFALTLFACQTKYDFTGWMPWLFGLLIGVIVFGMVSMFFPTNSTVELVYSGVVALLFSAYIVSTTLFWGTRWRWYNGGDGLTLTAAR